MTKQYDNTNSGILFKNNQKKEDKHPDYKGSFTGKDGEEYWLAGWIKENDRLGKFISFKLSLKDESSQGRKPIDDDVPF